jgi:hexokinase
MCPDYTSVLALFSTHDILELYFVSNSDTDEFFRNTKQVLDELGVENYTTEDCKIVKYVCTLISARAAFLAAAGQYMCTFR